MLDPSIILSGRAPNVLGAMSAGMEMGQRQNEYGRMNALAQFDNANGSAIMGGDMNALGQRAALDLPGTMGMQQAQMGLQIGQQNLDMRRQEAQMAAQEYASRLSAEEAADQAAATVEFANGLAVITDPAQQAAYLQANGIDPASITSIDAFLAETLTAATMMDIRAQQTGGGDTGYGLNPQYGIDENGQSVILQLGDNGTAVQTQLPPGVSLAREPIRLDAGTEWILLDPLTREVVGNIPKNNEEAAAEAARGRVEGELEAEAVAAAPAAEDKAQIALNLIADIRNDPALPSILGSFQGRIPAGTPIIGGGQAGDDLNAKILQLEGSVFLEAYEFLRGAQAITNIEGEKGEAAIARLQRVQSPEAYRAALDDLTEVIAAGQERMRARAGQPATVPPPADQGAAATDAPPAAFVSDPSITGMIEGTSSTPEAIWAAMTPEQRALWN